VIVSGARRAVDAGGHPAIDKGVVSASGIKEGETIVPAPNDHFTTGPHRRVSASGARCVGSARRCPTVDGGIVSSTGVMIDETISSAPEIISLPLQTAACSKPGSRCVVVQQPSSYPVLDDTFRRLKSACAAASSPDDHFAAAPHCREETASGRVAGARAVQLSKADCISRWCW
jgi:hypothetical protein